MAVARCAHADCGRFVKADETWCAKHKTDAVFDIVRSAAEGAKAEALPHHADMAYAVSPQVQVFHGLDYIHRTYDQSEPMVYPDAANELARGKHRVKDKPCKRRWWQRKDNR